MKRLLKIQMILVLALCGSVVQAQTLKGSRTSIEKQYRAAVSYGFAFVKTASSLKSHMSTNQLIRVTPDRYIELHDVSYPYAVPGTKLFLSRLSAQYYNVCGEKLTVTSLLRPRDRQPANSVAHSVHPTGMAVDLRIPSKPQCRSWLEKTLLSLERENVLDVTREHYPPHYHVAVYARDYETRVATLAGGKTTSGLQNAVLQVSDADEMSAPHSGSYKRYVVRKGDTLSQIAARNGVRVAQLRSFNNVRGNLINVGQKLRIPSAHSVASTGSRQDVMAANEITHRVNRGDTLWRIANRYGTSVQQLRRVNGKTGDSLRVGQVLKISKG
ncbi:MAG: DUF5715 family protein [Halioglobus sp.]